MTKEEFLTELREQADIVRVVQDFTPLSKRGENWMGDCLFCKAKRMLSVNPEKHIFYCFGCHAGGSAVVFVRQARKVSLDEAVREVARKTGLPLPPVEF